jgi:hypothetical protein
LTNLDICDTRFGDIKVWIVMFSRGKVLGVRNVFS